MKNRVIAIVLFCFLLLGNGLNGQENRYSIVLAFGDQLDQYISELNITDLNKAFDSDYFTEQFFLIDTTEAELNEFNSIYHQMCDTILGNLVRRSIEGSFFYDFVNYYEDHYGNYYLIFRLYGEEGLNYHEYFLVFDENGQAQIGDVYVYITGEFFSQTLSQFYYPAITQFLNEKYFNQKKKALFESYAKLKVINEYIKTGKQFEAVMLYNSIPEEIQKEKIFLLYGLKLTNLDDNPEKYTELVNVLNEKYPDNPTIFLWNIDKYYVNGAYQKSMEMVDSLMRITGDDFLEYYKGNLYYQQQKYEKAEKSFTHITKYYPRFEEGFTSLFEIAVHNKKFDLATTCINVLVEIFYYEKEGLISNVEQQYLPYAQSEEFIRWKNKE